MINLRKKQGLCKERGIFMAEKILVINPGSTSTIIAVYDRESKLFGENIEHPADVISKYDIIPD